MVGITTSVSYPSGIPFEKSIFGNGVDTVGNVVSQFTRARESWLDATRVLIPVTAHNQRGSLSISEP